MDAIACCASAGREAILGAEVGELLGCELLSGWPDIRTDIEATTHKVRNIVRMCWISWVSLERSRKPCILGVKSAIRHAAIAIMWIRFWESALVDSMTTLAIALEYS
jgi:hypothetical protein